MPPKMSVSRFASNSVFFLSNTEEFTPHRPSRMSYIATDREGRWGVNSSVFDKKNTELDENRGPRRQWATRTTWRVPILVPWWWWWSRGVAPLLFFSFRSRSVVDLTSSVVDAVVSSKRSSNAVLSFPPSSPLSRLFDFEVRYESPIPGMMIPVARAHLMMMAAFAVAFC